MKNTSPSRIPAVLAFIIGGLFLALLGYSLFAASQLAGRAQGAQLAAGSFAASFLGAAALVCALLYLAAGVGLWQGRRWAWWMGLGLQVANLLLSINTISLELNPPTPNGQTGPAWILIGFLLAWIGLNTAQLLVLLSPAGRGKS